MFKANELYIKRSCMHILYMHAWLVCKNMKLSVFPGWHASMLCMCSLARLNRGADSFPYIHSSNFISTVPTTNETFGLGRSIVHLSQRPDGTKSSTSDSIIRYFSETISKSEFLSQLHDVMMDYIYCAGLSDYSDIRTVSENIGFLSMLYDAVKESCIVEPSDNVCV